LRKGAGLPVPLLVLFDVLKLPSNREVAQPRVLGFQELRGLVQQLDHRGAQLRGVDVLGDQGNGQTTSVVGRGLTTQAGPQLRTVVATAFGGGIDARGGPASQRSEQPHPQWHRNDEREQQSDDQRKLMHANASAGPIDHRGECDHQHQAGRHVQQNAYDCAAGGALSV
jgi:hypothetical protein